MEGRRRNRQIEVLIIETAKHRPTHSPKRDAAHGAKRTATPAEERANTITHLIGLAAAVVCTVWLVVRAVRSGDPRKMVTFPIFSVSMILMYLASSLYHAAKNPEVKRGLKVLDHSAIFVLIAGSYTPFTLVGLRGGWGWSLFGVIWGLAIAGVVFKLFFAGRFKFLSTMLYIAMGWLVVIAAGPMGRSMASTTIFWVALGGVAYTLGTIFYLNKRIPYTHAVWHLFVLAGTLTHAVAVATLA